MTFLARLLLCAALLLGATWIPQTAQAQTTPKCYINGGSQLYGCIPASIKFKLYTTASSTEYPSFEAAKAAHFKNYANSPTWCHYFGGNEYCPGFYTTPITYYGRTTGNQCGYRTTAANLPTYTRNEPYAYNITYNIALYSKRTEQVSCNGNPATTLTLYTANNNGNPIFIMPVCPRNYTILAEIPSQFSGNYGYYCSPAQQSSPRSSTARNSCEDGPRPGCGTAGNPVDLAQGRRKTDRVIDLVVEGDYPIVWERTYFGWSTSESDRASQWSFAATKIANSSFLVSTGLSKASVRRADGGYLMFTGTGTPGSRVWVVSWGNISDSYRIKTLTSTLRDWVENGAVMGLILSRDDGHQEYYDNDGLLVSETNPQGRTHVYQYDSDGKLVRIEQDNGRHLDINYTPMPAYGNPDSVTVDVYDPDPNAPPVQETYQTSSLTAVNLRTDMFYIPQVASVSDGTRTVRYTWSQPYQQSYSPLLMSVENPDGELTYYHYGENTQERTLITGISDADGRRRSTYVYSSYADQTNNPVSQEWQGAGVLAGDAALRVNKLTLGSTITDQLGNTYSWTGGESGNFRITGYTKDCPVCSGVKAKTFTYNTLQQITRLTDFNNVNTDFTYDAKGRVATRKEAVGTPLVRETSYTWDPNIQLPLTQTEPVVVDGVAGTRTTTWTYNTTNQPLTRTVVAPGVGGGTVARTWTYAYDTDGRLASITDPEGLVTQMAYNSYGDLVGQVTRAGTAGERMTRWGSYEADGKPRWSMDADNVATVWTWDGNGQLLESRQGELSSAPSSSLTLGATSWAPTLPGSGTRDTAYTYSAAGLLTRVDLMDGTRLDMTYDHAARLTQIDTRDVNDALVSSTVLTLDAMSNVTRTVLKDGAGATVLDAGVVRDDQYRVRQALNAAQQALFTQNYDGQHRPTTSTDILARPNQNQYDVLGRMVKHFDALNQQNLLTYGPSDEVLSATDVRGVVTNYAYNGFGDLIRLVSPDRGTWEFGVDAAGRRVSAQDPRGVVATTLYDAAGRPSSVTFSDAGVSGTPAGFVPGNQTQTFTYDACTHGVGRLCGVSDASGTASFVYDAWGQVTGKAWTGAAGTPAAGVTLSTGYVFDDLGRLQSTTYPSGKTSTRTYGADGRLSTVTYDGQSVVSDVQWTAFDAVAGWTWGATGLPSGATQVHLAYDANGMPAQIEDVETRDYVVDAAQRIVGSDDPMDANRSQVYGYDNLDRLTSADVGAWGGALNYGFDAGGNTTSKTDTVSGLGTAYTYGATNNKLLTFAPTVAGVPGVATAQTHDAMGSLINDGIGMTLGYDVTGRLVQTTRAPSSTTQAYNALGQRVRKTTTGTGAGTVLYAYDEAGRLLGAYRVESGAPGGFVTEEEQVFLEGWRLLATVRPDASLGMSAPVVYPVLTDHLGTPRKVLDPVTGFTRWDWDAKEPFGMQAPNNDPSGSGAFVLDARFPGQRYDAETGLYHNGFRDYHAGLGRYVQSDPLGLEAGWNTYAYVGSSPLGTIDPSGLDWMNTLSNAISAADQHVVDLFERVHAPAVPQKAVDYMAGWGDNLTFSATKLIREQAGTNEAVCAYSDAYKNGELMGMANGVFLGGYGAAGAAIKAGQRGVPAGMVMVTRWGRAGLKEGDWVMVGGKNAFNYNLSGIRNTYGFDNAASHFVPKASLKNPWNFRPANEAYLPAALKQFFGLNHLQKIYIP